MPPLSNPYRQGHLVSRIVIINDNLLARGGAEVLAILSARLFNAYGLPITFFTGDSGNAAEFRDLGIDVVEAGGTSIADAPTTKALVDGLYFPNSRRSLEKWIFANDTQTTVYHVHSWSKILSPSIFAALRPVAARTVLHAHDFFAICPNGGFTNYRRGINCDLVGLSAACVTTNCDKRNYAHKLWRVGRHVVRQKMFDITSLATDHIVLHEGMIPFFVRAGVPSERLQVIHNPIDFVRSERIAAETNSRIMFIGRLAWEKGPQDLAQAARLAGAALTMIGDGPLREELETTYPEVEFTGWCAPADITSRLAGARFLVVPSRWRETFGLVAVEALRLGIPVVISRQAMIAERVTSLGAGLTVDTSDVVTLSELLKDLLTHNSVVREMSKKALAAAQSLTLGTDEWRDALLFHYDRMLSRTQVASAGLKI